MIEQQRNLIELGSDDWRILPSTLQWRLVSFYRQCGELALAHKILDGIEAERGGSAKLYEHRAMLAEARGDDDDAAHWLRRRAEERPSATAWIGVVRHHLARGELAEATEISDALHESDPDLLSVMMLGADVALEHGDRQRARALLAQAHELFPDNLSVFLANATLAQRLGDAAQADSWWQRACAAAGEEAGASSCAAIAETGKALGRHSETARYEERAAQLRRQAEQELAEKIDAALLVSAPPPAEDLVTFSIPEPITPNGDTSDAGPPLDPRVLETLQRAFGHTALRPGQIAVIERALAGRDTLAIMPTGAGKSLTFQLPAMMLPGTTLVISPLIALMKDQLESLPSAVRERSALINSTLSAGEIRERLRLVRSGSVKMLYIAPERFRDHLFLRALQEIDISLAVVDEAHCISLWGSDFRPDYLFIPKALAELGDPPLLAVTATATPEMARQIATGLYRDLDVQRISIFRPNLTYKVIQLRDREQKIAQVIDICRREEGTGIVYVRSRKDAESIAGVLRDNGVQAIPYHAGLAPEIRAANQERFMTGRVRVVVATVAFGMGVDKADVRFIIHQSPPDSLEAYAQESGRAGRDGQQARCVLLATPSDAARLKTMARRDEIGIETLRQVYAAIKAQAVGAWAIFDPQGLETQLSTDPDQRLDSRVALGILEQAGLIVRHPDAPDHYTIRRPAQPEATDHGALARLEGWLETQQVPGVISTAAACQATGMTPFELDRLLIDERLWNGRPGRRGVCVQFLPPPPNIGRTMSDLLERTRANDDRRIDQVIAYIKSHRCRHAMLAAHLGEKLEPCGTACDVCRGTGQTTVAAKATVGQSSATKEDAMTVLTAVANLPYPMGRTGLAKLLVGSLESRVREDRAPRFGALKHLKKSAVERLINQLTEEGFLHRDLSHEFFLLSLTAKGRDATLGDLAHYDGATASKRRTASTLTSAEERERHQRLLDWRRRRIEEDEVPGYVIATNAMLLDVAAQNPESIAELEQIAGFGDMRIEKYGSEILHTLELEEGG
jgi:ATP-dependent DNA helicase RecQ